MILAAGLLVLAGLGLFVGGVLTGVTALYWGCVAACVVAAVLLFVARRQIATAPAKAPATSPAERATTSATPTAPAAETGEGAAAPAGATAASATETAVEEPVAEQGDPSVEEVEVTDLLIVVDLKDEVLVVDEHPRYHLPGCRYLSGHTPIPLPLDEARTDGFTPCAVCAPDRNLAQRAREKKSAG
ncbi:hypothetical protein ACI78T_11625 [Blastococcus sp. SYSU D00922]